MKGRSSPRTSAVAPARAPTTPPRRTPSSKAENGQLRWALWFAQADLAQWREGDWLNALEDLKWLVTPLEGQPLRESGTALASLALTHPLNRRGHPKRPDVAEVKRWLSPLQQALRTLFEKLDHQRYTAAVDEEGDPFVAPVGVPFTGEAVLAAEPPYRRLQMFFTPKGPNLQQQFVSGAVLRVSDLLTRVDFSRLKRCPECKRLFLAVRRQRFDTRQCSLRDSQRRFRQKQVRRPAGKETTR
jgi:hypothetical protein